MLDLLFQQHQIAVAHAAAVSNAARVIAIQLWRILEARHAEAARAFGACQAWDAFRAIRLVAHITEGGPCLMLQVATDGIIPMHAVAVDIKFRAFGALVQSFAKARVVIPRAEALVASRLRAFAQPRDLLQLRRRWGVGGRCLRRVRDHRLAMRAPTHRGLERVQAASIQGCAAVPQANIQSRRRNVLQDFCGHSFAVAAVQNPQMRLGSERREAFCSDGTEVGETESLELTSCERDDTW